jgi:hypothetical protein
VRTGTVQEQVRRCGPRRASGRGQGRAARLTASEAEVGAAGDAAARMEQQGAGAEPAAWRDAAQKNARGAGNGAGASSAGGIGICSRAPQGVI